MPELRSRVSWEEIVQSAARRIRQDGIDALDLDDLREDVGAAPGAVRYWFSNKADLLISIMQVRQRWFLDQADARTTAHSGHARKLREVLDLATADHDMTYWIELWKLGRHDERARRARQELIARYRVLLSRVIRAGQRDGEFAPVAADQAALILASLITGLSVEATISGEASVDRIHAALVSAAERLLAVDLSAD